MGKINKIVLVVFSVIILIIGVFVNLLVIGWLDYSLAFSLIRNGLTNKPSGQIILVITELCMVFAAISIFADSSEKKERKNGKDVLMQNDNGKLMISRDTIENIVDSVVSKFSGAREARTIIGLDEENNVTVLVDLTVTDDVIIKELTLNLQNRIKEAIKKTSDLDVKEVDVRIKNVISKPVENAE